MAKKRAFFAAPFDNYMNLKSGKMLEDKIELIDRIVMHLELKGYTVHNAHKREKYGENCISPEICTSLDFENIKNSDIVIAIPGDPPSGGVHIELGWATVLNTSILIMLEEGKKYSKLVLGLGAVGNVKYTRYQNLDECLREMDKLL